MLADQRARVIQRHQPQLVSPRVDRDLQHRRPPAQHRPAQTEEQPPAIDRQSLDVEAVVLARDLEVRTEVRVVGQRAGQQIRLGVALQPQRPAAILRLPHQHRLAVGVGLDRQAGQQPTVAVQRDLRQSLGVRGMRALRLGVLALQPVRTDHPQVAIGDRHAFEVSLLVRRRRQVQQLGQREIADLAIAQGLAADRIQPPQAIHATGLVTGHPQPVAREGRTGQIAVHEGTRREFESHGIGGTGVGHGSSGTRGHEWQGMRLDPAAYAETGHRRHADSGTRRRMPRSIEPRLMQRPRRPRESPGGGQRAGECAGLRALRR